MTGPTRRRRMTPPEEWSSARRGRRGSSVPRGQRRHVHPHRSPGPVGPLRLLRSPPRGGRPPRAGRQRRTPRRHLPGLRHPGRQRPGRRGSAAALQPDLLADIPTPRQVVEHLDRSVVGQGRAKRTLAIAVSNHFVRLLDALDRGFAGTDRHRPRPPGCHHREEQRPADRPLGLGEDPPGQGAGRVPGRPVRHRRRHHADRGRLCRRGRGERPPQAPARRQLGCAGRPAGHRLHRRDGQDPLGRCRRQGHAPGRPARPPEDDRGDGLQCAPERRLQEPDGAGHPVRHDERAVHLRRRLRRPGGDHRPAYGPGSVRVRPAGCRAI